MNPDPPLQENHPRNNATLTVYFDGGCPVCAREIAFYRRQTGADALRWVDAAHPSAELGADLDQAMALRRFHVRKVDGALVSGTAAFATLWRALPRFVWWGRIAGFRPVSAVLDLGYAVFLRFRRWWRLVPERCDRG